MKIHDILVAVFKDSSGQTFTFGEIQKQVRQRYPHLKPTSILPYEHITGKTHSKSCKMCLSEPIFTQVGRGFYKVLLPRQQEAVPAYSIHEKLVVALAAHSGQIMTVYAIKALVKQRFPDTHLPSIIVSDHMKGGACKECSQKPLLERAGQRGQYYCLPQSIQTPVRILPGDRQTPPEDFLQQKLLLVLKADPDRLFYQTPDSFAQQLQAALGSGYRREISVLTAALRERIPLDILEFAKWLPQAKLWERLASRLYENCGIAEAFARWGVENWGMALQHLFELIPRPHTTNVALVNTTYHTETVRIFAAECRLNKLTLNNTDTGYDALKKAHRNVAMALYLPEHSSYLVGLHKSHILPDTLALLEPAQNPLLQCPPKYVRRFSLYGHTAWLDERYSWFIGLTKPLVIQIFEQLDSQF